MLTDGAGGQMCPIHVNKSGNSAVFLVKLDDLWEKLTLELENPCDSDGHAIRIMRESRDSNVYEDSSRWFNHLGGEPLDPAASA